MRELLSYKAILRNTGRVVLLIGLLTASSAIANSNGQYDLNWYTIDGGGGQSSGGSYVLTGTSGQPDADWCSGGSYELLGGFWPGGPLCFVDFHNFARFADQWLDTGNDLAADLDGDGYVDFDDLEMFVEEWLNCCPYNWPLK